MANRRWKGCRSDRFPLLGLQNHCRRWLQPWNQKTIASWQDSDDKPRQGVEKQRQYSADKGLYSQGYGFAVVMFGCEKWNIKKAECQRIDAFKLWCWRRLLKSPLDNKEIKAVNLKGDHPWIFTGSDAEAETPVFWSSDANRQLIGKAPDAGKDQGWKEKRVSEDEIAGWHHQCSTPGLPVSHYLLELPEFIFIASVTKNWTQLGDWTTTTTTKYALLFFFLLWSST